MSVTRRGLLTSGLFTLAPFSWARALDSLPAKPKNIIFCVSDGMADQVPAMVDTYQQLVFGRNSYWHELHNREEVRFALQETRSLSSVVTDSSAAASAWGSGRRIWNGMVNMYPDLTELIPISHLMADKGVRCGLVTTCTITHATPAGFAVMTPDRDDEEKIAELYKSSGVSVLLGGGDKFFSGSKRKDKRDLYAEFKSAGFDIAKTKSEMDACQGDKLLGIFTNGHIPYAVDHAHDPSLASVPTLPQMSAKAIAALKDSPNGFLLQIEGGRVDHGGHSNDLAAQIYDQIAFEESVKIAIDFAIADKNTLVIITADHATGGPSLNGDGQEYIDATAGLMLCQRMTCSLDVLTKDMGKQPSTDKVKEVVDARYAISLKDAEADAIAQAMVGKSPLSVVGFERGATQTIAHVLSNYSKVNYTSGNHTAEHVWVSAYGPGSELVRGVVKNVAFNPLMLGMKDITHENAPQMSFAAAAAAYAKLKGSGKLQAFRNIEGYGV